MESGIVEWTNSMNTSHKKATLFSQSVYDLLLHQKNDGLLNKIFIKLLRYCEKWILRNGSVVVRYDLCGKDVILPWEHTLPYILKNVPHYAFNLARIGCYVQKKYKEMHFIDIGANIGDTVVLQRTEAKYPILCIEGDPYYYSVLENNVSAEPDVTLVHAFVGDKNELHDGLIDRHSGTGTIYYGGGVDKIRTKTLQTILHEHPNFANAKMLKIDTDGFDLKILRGARNYLKKEKPILFYEYDPFFLFRQGDDGLSIFPLLHAIGYRDILVYDNLGDFIVSCTVSDTRILHELHAYYSGRKGTMYYDLCVFHKNDADIFEYARTQELHYFCNSRK
jgi:FkbM family methyltransferase